MTLQAILTDVVKTIILGVWRQQDDGADLSLYPFPPTTYK